MFTFPALASAICTSWDRFVGFRYHSLRGKQAFEFRNCFHLDGIVRVLLVRIRLDGMETHHAEEMVDLPRESVVYFESVGHVDGFRAVLFGAHHGVFAASSHPRMFLRSTVSFFRAEENTVTE